MNINIDFPKKLATAYNAVCNPLCRELNIPQTAFDILMFLANNPDYSTAGDIVNIRYRANRHRGRQAKNSPLADREGSADRRARQAAAAGFFRCAV